MLFNRILQLYFSDVQSYLDDTVYEAYLSYDGQKLGQSADPPKEYVTAYEEPVPYGQIDLQKSSTNPEITDGNEDFSLKGAVYGLWTSDAWAAETDKNNPKNPTETQTTDKDGKATWDYLKLGTYYVKEITPPEFFELDTTVHTYTLTKDNAEKSKYYNTVEIESREEPIFGQIDLQKQSSVPNLTDGIAAYSLEGAVYGLWTSDAWAAETDKNNPKNPTETQTTDKDGKATWTKLKPDTYYVKEITPPEFFELDTTVHTYKITKENAEKTRTSSFEVRSKETPVTGHIDLRKVSSRTDLTDGHPDYSYKGATYGLWKGEAHKDCTGTPYETGITDADGYISWTVVIDKYYVKEIETPENYKLDETIYEFEITEDNVLATKTFDKGDLKTVEITAKEEPVLGAIDLLKKSSNPNLTDGNKCYSLMNAEYGLWSSDDWEAEPDKNNPQNPTEIQSTNYGAVRDENGNVEGYLARWEELVPDYYYVKEITPPPGYAKNDTVYEVDLVDFVMEEYNDPKTIEVTAEDTPKSDPAGISISKMWNGEILPTTPDIPSLEGTQFTIKYYDGYYDTMSKLPGKETRKWVLEVKKNPYTGKFETGLREMYLTNDSDDLYLDGDGDPVLPLGTCTIQETKTAPGYTFEGEFHDANGKSISPEVPYLTQIKSENDEVKLTGGNEFSVSDETNPINLTLVKKDTKGKPLSGVKFQLSDGKGSDPILDRDGNPVDTVKTTDSRGYVEWENLKPETYTITEVETVDGQTLLAEPIVVEAPLKMTPEEVKEHKIDESKITKSEKDNAYYVFDFTYEVTNGATFIMPMSGVGITVKRYLPLAAGMVLLIAAIYAGYPILTGKRRRKSKK